MEIETRKCNKCKNDFELDQDDFSFYEKMKVPAPNVCPDCRFKMRAQWRNEIILYSSINCNLCGKSVISMYNPKLNYRVYCMDCYMSDSWNPKEFYLEFNYSKPFFEQYIGLMLKIPKKNLVIDLSNGPVVNSYYTNFAGGMKDCYMVFNGGTGENMLYCRGVSKAKEISDCYFGENIELCYECVNVNKSNGVVFGNNVLNCIDSYFLSNCANLVNCFGCVNLRNKSNYYFNEQLDPEEYKKRIKEIKGSYKKLEEEKNKFVEFCKKFPHKENNNIKTIDCAGEYIYQSKNIKNSFEVSNSENCNHLFSSKIIKDSIGTIGFGYKAERLLEVVSVGYSNNVIGSVSINSSQEIMYSSFMINCHDCIGCDGLKNAEYCILNKQYSKEEYEKIKEHIVKELTGLGIHGLMMPSEIAPFAYNETIAQDNLPLTKEEALAQGFRWEDDIQMTKGKETLGPENIPDYINDVKDEITKEVLKCIACERNYKITEQELLFYRKMILPIPRKCFFCRHKERIIRRGPFKFFKRNCDNCDKETYTNLTKEVAPIMYCEKCYQQEVI